jgi:AraC-like DNA-binding protein
LSQSPDDFETVIVVAPPEISRRIVRDPAVRVVAFQSLEELDRWRAERVARPGTLLGDLNSVLNDLGLHLLALPKKLRTALEAIASGETILTTRDLEMHWPSRRSFYRMWSESIAEPPSSFLRLVRAAHAERLLASGCPSKEAAALAGFSSVDRMKRAIAGRK